MFAEVLEQRCFFRNARAKIVSLVLPVLIFAGCAARYHDIEILHDGPAAPSAVQKVTVEIRCDPLDSKNPRFHNHMIHDRAQVIQITVNNATDSNFFFSKKNLVFSRSADPRYPMDEVPLDPEKVKKYGLPAWPYWFWSPLFLVINNWVPIPLGILIGALQFTKAIKSNDSFRLDLQNNIIKDGMIAPHKCAGGLLLLNTDRDNLCYGDFRCILKDVNGNVVCDTVVNAKKGEE